MEPFLPNVFISKLGTKTTSLLVTFVDDKKVGDTIRREEDLKNVREEQKCNEFNSEAYMTKAHRWRLLISKLRMKEK